MNQAVTIHGRTYVLTNDGGGAMKYRVTDPRSGATIAQAWSRFLAVALAAKAVLA